MAYKRFKVLGLQRSGTNWISTLINQNFKIDEEAGFWKHLTPLGVKNSSSVKPFTTSIVINSDTFYILVKKDFANWSKSIHRQPEDFYNTHTSNNLEVVYQSWTKLKNNLLQNNNMYFRDYLDWLNNWEGYLNEIQAITGWQKRYEEFINVSKVPRSHNFNINNYI